MTGGLIQLVTTGIQDSPIIGNPEITFFKTVYRQHTMFSLCQNERFIGNLDFNKESTKILEKNGDLLYNQYFKLEIPYFDIVKKSINTEVVDFGYNINELSVNYMNDNCLVFLYNDSWYIVPENLYNLSSFDSIINQIDASLLVPELLPEYIKISNVGQYANYYQIKDNELSSVISILRVTSNFFEQFWIDYVSKTDDINMLNTLITIKSDYASLNKNLKYRILNLFFSRNFSKKNLNYYYFGFNTGQVDSSLTQVEKTETERYFEYLNSFDIAKNNKEYYDIDIAYNYCVSNFLNFDDYKNNILPYNSLLILLILKLLYSSPSLNFLFWKKYNLDSNNEVKPNIKITETNLGSEWKAQFDKYLEETIGKYDIKNHIFEQLQNKYYFVEEQINGIFENLELDNPKELYIKLKTIMNRFYSIPYYQLNFNDYYLSTYYGKLPENMTENDVDVNSLYLNDNYDYLLNNETTNYPLLINNLTKLDLTNEMNNITPIDIQNIYGIIAQEVINLNFNTTYLNKSLKSFFILWRNCVITRLYKRYLETYEENKTNGSLFDIGNDARKLTFYHSLFPSSMYFYDDFKNSFYEMFYKNSWLGNWSYDIGKFIKIKENIFNVDVEDLSLINESSNKNFNKLEISNKYTYQYYIDQQDTNYINSVKNYNMEDTDNYGKHNFKKIKLNIETNDLYVKYDNFYDKNSIITLFIKQMDQKLDITQVIFDGIEYNIQKNERNFNSLYLVFKNVKINYNNSLKKLSNIYHQPGATLDLKYLNLTINVTYKTYLPAICFSNNKYPNFNVNKYYLLTKFENNEPNILNIKNNKITIDNTIINNDNIKVLTINYLDYNNKLIAPPKLSGLVEPSDDLNSLDIGKYLYRVSYYSSTAESNTSEPIEIKLTSENNIIKFIVPVSDNYSVIGRKIYRTRADSQKFYLLVNIKNNVDTSFIDNINNDILGIGYVFDNNTNNIEIPETNNKTTKQIIKLVPNGDLFTVTDLNDKEIILPITYEFIKDIYIEEIDFSGNNNDTLKVIQNNCYTINNGKITINKISATVNDKTATLDGYYIVNESGDKLYQRNNGIWTLQKNGIFLLNILDQDYILTHNNKYIVVNVNGSFDIINSNDLYSNYLYYLVDSKNYKDSCKLVVSNQVVPFQTVPFVVINNNTINMETIQCYYYITFYNTITKNESLPSKKIYYYNSEKDIKITNFSPIYDKTYNSWNIYRTKTNFNNVFYYVGTLIQSENNIFIDNIPDSQLNKVYKEPELNITRQINQDLINRPTLKPEIITTNTNNNSGIYKYVITYYSKLALEEEETLPSDINSIYTSEIISKKLETSVKIKLPISNDIRVTGRKIYRTLKNENDFKLVNIIMNNTQEYYIDNTPDNLLSDSLDFTKLNTNANKKEYVILKIKINDFAPNLNNFISHSSDINFFNNKQLSDLSDYIFNKPFIMLFNNSSSNIFTDSYDIINSFNTRNIYFYNIPFKINETSTILLNDESVTYLLPISTQQFFVKEINEKYYSINNIYKPVETNEIIQTRFNPSFDEFNLTMDFLNNNYYSDIFIDNVVEKLDIIIDTNSDYKKIINVIDQTNNKYINIFTDLLKESNYNLYGFTSRFILINLVNLNKIPGINGNQLINYDLLSYLNLDYLSYSHNALSNRIIPNIKLKSNKNLSILSSIYQSYSSNNKISNNLSEYLKGVNIFFNNHIEYVNKNLDYLNISEPNNYKEELLSLDEIQQHKINNFYDYKGTENKITLLHPIIDSNIHKIKINYQTDKPVIINNFKLDENDQTIIITPDYKKNIKPNNYYDSKFIVENIKQNTQTKFNYMGILSIGIDSKYNFNDTYVINSGSTYFKFDDDKIYNANYNSSLGRYEIGNNIYENKSELLDCLQINPVEMKFSSQNNKTYELINLVKKFGSVQNFYKVKIFWENNEKEITADVGNIYITSFTNNYIIHMDKLFVNNNNKWEYAEPGIYYLNSNIMNYNKQYVRIISEGDIVMFTKLSKSIETIFYINETNINGYYEYVNDDYGYLYIMYPEELFFNNNNIMYQLNKSDYNSWEFTKKIKNYSIEIFKKVNYKCENLNLPNFKNYIYKFGNKFHEMSDTIEIFTGTNIDGIYFNIDDNDKEIYQDIKITLVNNMSEPTNKQINTFILNLSNNTFYKAIEVTNDKTKTSEIKWDKQVSGYFHILSENSFYNDTYYKILSDGKIIKNSINIYEKEEFIKIIANYGNPSTTPVTIKEKYLIFDNNLYVKINNSWILVIYGYFYISSNIELFNNKYVQISINSILNDNINNTLISNGNVFGKINKLSALNSSLELEPYEGYYIIDKKLYNFNHDISQWVLQTSGTYKLISNNSYYNNKDVIIESDGTIRIISNSITIYDSTFNSSNFINITANYYDIINKNPIINRYVINNDNLYIGKKIGWQKVVSGNYFISSDINIYDQKYVQINLEGIIKIINTFNNIRVNDGNINGNVINKEYIIDNNILYYGYNQKWVQVISGNYFIKSSNSNYNNKNVQIVPVNKYNNSNLQIITNTLYDPIINKVICVKKNPFIIKNNVIYSYHNDFDYSKQILQTDPNNFVLLTNLTSEPNSHYMLEIKDIESKQIPEGNYYCWILNKNYLTLISYQVNMDIDGIGNIQFNSETKLPTNSYYMIKYKDNSCIYYYSNNSFVQVYQDIKYYNIRNVNIDQIFLIDNGLFNVKMKQLLKITKTNKSSENFITKELVRDITEFKFDYENIDNLYYDSDFIKDQFNIKYWNDNNIGLVGNNEIFAINCLQVKSNKMKIYSPVVVKKFEPFDIPNLLFYINLSNYNLINPTQIQNYYDYNYSTYQKSQIAIYINNLYLNGTTLAETIIIGKLNINESNTDYFKSLNPNLEIDNVTKLISIRKGYDITSTNFSIHLWKIEAIKTTEEIYNIYIWTIFSNDLTTINNYLTLNTKKYNNMGINTNIGISEPLYTDINGNLTIPGFGQSHYLLGGLPNIFIQNSNDYQLILNDQEREIGYKYYSDTRDVDTTNNIYQVKQLDYNMLHNIKPTIDLWTNNNSNTIPTSSEVYSSANIFIITYNIKSTNEKNIVVFLKSEFNMFVKLTNNSDIYNISTYFSIDFPQFINNKIILTKKINSLYLITNYKKLLLEPGEIIVLDSNYFYVEGLNVFNDYYELTLIRSGKTLRNIYNGYYTIGNYLRKDNNIIPDISYQNLTTFYSSKLLSYGDIYYSNIKSKLVVSDNIQTLSNVNLFNESNLNVKLLYNSGNLFLFDNFIKLKILDKIMFNDEIYEIINIRDCQIFLNKQFLLENKYDNKFINFTLPYQPFITKYINIDSDGNILSESIPNNQTIIYDYLDSLIQTITVTIDDTGDILTSEVLLDKYVINENTLYFGDNNGWEKVSVGIYLIISDGSDYNNNYYWIDVNNQLNLFKNIEVNNQTSLNVKDVDQDYIIYKNSLYTKIITNNQVSWKKQTSGYFYISDSNIEEYVDELVTINENGNIIICTPNLFTVTNNKIDIKLIKLFGQFDSGYKWVRIWETNYKSQFENLLYIPENLSVNDYEFNSNYPIKIETEYDSQSNSFKLLNDLSLLSKYKFNYSQPVQVLGTYNYIKSINIDKQTNIIYISLINNILFNPDNLQDIQIHMIISPQIINEYEHFSQLKFKFNSAIQSHNYNDLNGKTINVLRYIIKNDNLVFTQKYINNKEIQFTYGLSIAENEKLNEIQNIINGEKYESIYFYNNRSLNSDGTIDAFDTLIGSWHQVYEKYLDFDNVHLAKIIYPNKIKLFTQIQPYFYDFSLDRMFGIKVNKTGEFIYSSLVITESRKMIEINENVVEIIKKYNVRLVGIPNITNGKYYQEIIFTNNSTISEPVNYLIYSTIYLDDKLEKEYSFIYDENDKKYFIISDEYLVNNIKYIYTKNINYMISSEGDTIKKNMLLEDPSIEYYIKSKNINTELLINNISLSKINPNNTNYYYKNIDDTINFKLTNNENYKIGSNYNKVSNINPLNNVFTSTSSVDIDALENSNQFVKTVLYIENPIDISNIVDSVRLFNNVKQLRTKLLSNSQIDTSVILNYVKSWKAWSILSTLSINKISQVVNLVYLSWDSSSQKVIKTTNPTNIKYSYLTNNELNMLSSFLESINKSNVTKSNFITMKNIIEPLIFNNLINWISHPSFFLNVKDNINEVLKYSGYDVYFDGNNILFNDDTNTKYITIDEQKEITNYISNEFTYDEKLNIVYRSTNSYNNISKQFGNWINKINSKDINEQNFGVSVHKLCRYLVVLGDQLKELMNYLVKPLTDTPEYVYNNPIKFLINKLWEKYNKTNKLIKLNKEFTDDIVLKFDIKTIDNIYSSINYFNNLSIGFNGKYSKNRFIEFYYNSDSEFNITNINIEYPNISTSITPARKLITKSVYPYTLNFSNNEIIPNSKYSIDFLNGENITTDIIIDNPTINPNQISFYSENNIKTNDFFVVKQTNEFTINNTILLGHHFIVKFNDYINNNYIDQIYYRTYDLPIIKKNLEAVNFVIPYDNNDYDELSGLAFNDLLELRSIVLIKNKTTIGDKHYLNFYNLKFNFINGKSLLKTTNKTYLLMEEEFETHTKFYIIDNNIPDFSENPVIITLVNPYSITNMNEILYRYKLSSQFNNSIYLPENENLIVPLEFKLKNSKTNVEITPCKISSLGDNNLIFYFIIDDFNIIKTNNGWDKIIQVKKIDQNMVNQIENIYTEDEYLYKFTYQIPQTTTTKIFLYTTGDIDIPNGIFEPINNQKLKTSIYFKQDNDMTSFTTNTNIEISNLNNYSFIQKNSWNITTYNLDSNNKLMSFIIPNDFILKLDNNYYYNIVDSANKKYILNKNSFIFENNIITFNWSYENINGTIVLNQYFIEDSFTSLQIPELNKKVKITLGCDYQYYPTDNFYIVPYSGSGKEFHENLYIIQTSELTSNMEKGFESSIENEIIYLYSNGKKYSGQIFDKYLDNYVYLVIALKEIIDVNLSYTYTLNDNIMRKAYNLKSYQKSFNLAQYYNQDSIGSIYLFVKDSLKNYDYVINSVNLIKRPNKFYLVSYKPYNLINIFNENKFTPSGKMNKDIIYKYTEIETKEKPSWIKFSKLFEHIKLYFNDQQIEELNENTFDIDYNLYSTEEKRKQIDNLTKFRLVNNKWEVYIPLSFWFANKPGLSIPIVALPYTELRLKYKLNDLSLILENELTGNYSFSVKPQVKINLTTDFILLDTLERKLFGSFSHEYIIDIYKQYPDNFINNSQMVIQNKFTGLIKDIHIITKPVNHKKINYYPNVITKYDSKYARYVKAIEYYNLYKINNVYTSLEQKDYSYDIEIIDLTLTEFNNYIKTFDKTQPQFNRITRLIDNFGNWELWDSNYDLLKYLMYYEDYYLKLQTSDKKKNNILTLYLKYMFSNKKIIEAISPIESMNIKVNGTDLFSPNNWRYFTYLTPYKKFKNTNPDGFYSYSFSLYPTEDQHSGHLNFSNFDDMVYKIESNPLVETEPYKIKNVVKEYNILRIMSGLGSLGWIN